MNQSHLHHRLITRCVSAIPFVVLLCVLSQGSVVGQNTPLFTWEIQLTVSSSDTVAVFVIDGETGEEIEEGIAFQANPWTADTIQLQIVMRILILMLIPSID